MAARVSRVMAAAFLCAAAALVPAKAADGTRNAQIPDLTMKAGLSWMEVGDEYIAPPSGPGPIIINEGGPEVRRVHMNVQHSANPKPSWYGESIGHYENGDTLVVDTVGISTKSFVDNYRTPHTDKLHVVERFRLINDGKMLEDTITVEDPGTFTTPWSAIQRWRMVENRPLIEDICAENNFAFFDYGVAPMPHSDRPDF